MNPVLGRVFSGGTGGAIIDLVYYNTTGRGGPSKECDCRTNGLRSGGLGVHHGKNILSHHCSECRKGTFITLV